GGKPRRLSVVHTRELFDNLPGIVQPINGMLEVVAGLHFAARFSAFCLCPTSPRLREALMFNFANVSKLSGVLRTVHKTLPGELGREKLARLLEADFGFIKESAQFYASTVLARKVEGLGDWVTGNAGKVIGTWMTSTQSGIPGGWQTTKQETWEFMSDLTFEHKRNTYESYWSPISNYSRPTSWSERGLWAPSDSEPGNELYLVLLGYPDGIARPMQLIWPDDSERPGKFSIGGTVYVRQW